ncbi:MAG: hypothetical protein KIT43_02830 [Bauldia sp.]|nr:hypothetical protein [Bauldia sp.]
MGRGHQPDPLTRRQVEAMAGYGVPEVDIGGIIGIDPKTLRKHYRAELDYGHTKANIKVAENLYRKATGEGRESVTAAIFWLKARAGWREKQIHEIQTPEPVTFTIERIIVDPTNPEATLGPNFRKDRADAP